MIHNSIDFLGLVFTFHCKQVMFMDVFVQNTCTLFCTCSAFPSNQIPYKTFCSLSNCCFSFPFFSSRSSSLNDLNVLGIFSQDFLQQFICCKRSEHLRYPGYFCSRQKAHIFSLKLTRFIRTPVNTDNGHFSVSRVTNSHIL